MRLGSLHTHHINSLFEKQLCPDTLGSASGGGRIRTAVQLHTGTDDSRHSRAEIVFLDFVNYIVCSQPSNRKCVNEAVTVVRTVLFSCTIY